MGHKCTKIILTIILIRNTIPLIKIDYKINILFNIFVRYNKFYNHSKNDSDHRLDNRFLVTIGPCLARYAYKGALKQLVPSKFGPLRDGSQLTSAAASD